LDLEWNTIRFGPNQQLSECYALEFTCLKFLVPTFGEILARIFHKRHNNFPYKQGELRLARCGGQITPEVAIACMQEHSKFTAEWTGLEVYHLSCPNRKYRNTPMTIKDYILHKTGGLRMVPTIDSEESGKYIIMIKKGEYKLNFNKARGWYNFEMHQYFEEYGVQKPGWPPTSTYRAGYRAVTSGSHLDEMCKDIHHKVATATA
jgi:hypothetical protein